MKSNLSERFIRLFLVAVFVAAVVFSWRGQGVASVGQQAGSREDAALVEARKLTGELTDKVRTLLMQELEKGGYEGAVRACAEVAQKVTSDFNQRTGQYARRVSLGYRNPKDIPDEYEFAKLQEFDRLKREQKLENEYYEVVREKDVEYLRYMKPLITGRMCLNCHGQVTEVPHGVMNLLQRRYPNDKALGYNEGDVRGAVSVKIALTKQSVR
ncbi:MAG: DUF3365 domain-containing protein [Acidobacteria bacterium]|nr:DUF3365 domain-containing protein [Acidobacteriota bacterium]